jgi:hypothetical protein
MLLQVVQGLEIRCAKGLCLANVESLYTNLFKAYEVHKYPLSQIGIMMNSVPKLVKMEASWF